MLLRTQVCPSHPTGCCLNPQVLRRGLCGDRAVKEAIEAEWYPQGGSPSTAPKRRRGHRHREGRPWQDTEDAIWKPSGKPQEKPTLPVTWCQTSASRTWESRILLFKPSRLWYFIMATPANEFSCFLLWFSIQSEAQPKYTYDSGEDALSILFIISITIRNAGAQERPQWALKGLDTATKLPCSPYSVMDSILYQHRHLPLLQLNYATARQSEAHIGLNFGAVI